MSNSRTMLANYLLGSGDLKKNFVKNPIGHRNAINITTSGTATAAKNTTTPLTAESDIQIALTAVDDYAEFETDSLDRAMKSQNCEVKFDYKMSRGADATVLARVMDGTDIAAEMQLISEDSVRPVSLNFACPDPATADLTVRLIQTVGSDTSTLNVTNVYLGKATNVHAVQQSEIYGTLVYPGTTNCVWSTNSTGSFSNFSVDNDCGTPTVTNKVEAPSTKIPGVRAQNLPAGKYKVTATFTTDMFGGVLGGALRLSDGTNGASAVNPIQDTNDNAVTLTGVFEYNTAQSDITWQIQGRTSGSGSTFVQITANTATYRDFNMIVERYPLDSQLALTPELGQWRVDANIGGGNFDLGAGAVSTYSGMSNSGMDLVNNTDKGSHSSVGIGCSGTNSPGTATCPAGSENNAIHFEIPTPGIYEACVSFSTFMQASSGSNGTHVFQIFEIETDSQTNLQEGGARLSTGQTITGTSDTITPYTLCGTFKFDTVGQKMLSLKFEKSGTAVSNVQADRNATRGQRDIHWTVERKTAEVKPVLVNSVTTNDATPHRVESAFVDNGAGAACSSSPCTASIQSGSWLTSVTKAGAAGNYTLNIASGIFASTPLCVATCVSTTKTARVDNTSSTAINVKTSTPSTLADANAMFNVICMGKKGSS